MNYSSFSFMLSMIFVLPATSASNAQELAAERILPQPENTGRCRNSGGWGACQYKLYLTDEQLAKALEFDRENNEKAKELGLQKE